MGRSERELPAHSAFGAHARCCVFGPMVVAIERELYCGDVALEVVGPARKANSLSREIRRLNWECTFEWVMWPPSRLVLGIIVPRKMPCGKGGWAWVKIYDRPTFGSKCL